MILKKVKKNIIFPAIHGINGEDGTIQGLLELIDVPYVGNEVLSSAVGMDKVIMRDIFAKHNIPQTKYTSFRLHSWKDNEEKCYKQVEEKIGYPCYIKPANSGSSVGISKAENRKELKNSFQEAFLYDCKIIVEKK